MSGNAIFPARKPATATSSAAASATSRVPPAAAASRTSLSAGNRDSSGARNVSEPRAGRSSAARAAGRRSGQVNAYCIGTRMSGGASCASVLPSANVASECTTDSGCIATSMASSGTPKSQCASTISNPLFIMVAESMLTFGPIRQVGCRNAISGVTAERSGGPSRNGPPLAVSVIRERLDARSPCRHWKIALCSLSTGMIGTPFSRARDVTSPPAATSTSFVASATGMPRAMASSVGARPESPTVATRTRSASVSRTARAAASSPANHGAENSLPSRSASPARERTATPATRKSSGWLRMTSSAAVPIEPVAPRTRMRFTAAPGR